MSQKPKLLTIPQAMALLRCSRSKIYRLHHSGALHFVKMGRATRISAEAVRGLSPRAQARAFAAARTNPMRMRVARAAHYVGLSMSQLNVLRRNGGGPRYIKLGNTVLYDLTDLDTWVNANKFFRIKRKSRRRHPPRHVRAAESKERERV